MLNVLQSKHEINAARQQMDSMGVSTLESFGQRLSRKLHLSKQLPVGDRIKSWDVLATLQFLKQHLGPDDAILDIGAYCSEVPVALAKLGNSRVHAIDLNPNIKQMPLKEIVSYEIGNFLATNYPDQQFDAITAISVIEHGYQPEALFKEMSRLLKPGGLFIASFDYWREKIDTGTTKFFDMSWLIFSQEDVNDMMRISAQYGLEPMGEMNYSCSEKPISCLGFDYTFAKIVLRKKV